MFFITCAIIEAEDTNVFPTYTSPSISTKVLRKGAVTLNLITNVSPGTTGLLNFTLSILAKYVQNGGSLEGVQILAPDTKHQKELMIEIAKFNAMMENAYEESAPHKICAYIYDLCNAFNSFYHETKIMAEEDETKKAGYIALLALTKRVLEVCIDVLGFEAPERM